MPATGCPLLLCPRAREIGSQLPSLCSGIPVERASFRNRVWEFNSRSNLGGTDSMSPCSSGLPISCSPKLLLVAGGSIRPHIPITFPEFLDKDFVSTWYCMRWVYKSIAFSLERELWFISRGGRRNDNHKSDRPPLSQVGFYCLCESIFSSLFCAVSFHCRLSQGNEVLLDWVAGHFQ